MNIRYNHDVLNKKVAVTFKVGKGKTARPYVGTIRRVQIGLDEEDDGKYEVLHEVVFNDGEEHWLDLAEVEDQGRLAWFEFKTKSSSTAAPSEKPTETARSEIPKPTEKENPPMMKKLGGPIRANLNKAKLARRTMLKSLVAACSSNANVAAAPEQPPKKKRKHESMSAKKKSSKKKPKPEVSTPGDGPDWVEDMYDWMVHIGLDGRGATPKSALRIRKEVLNLATGQGITHKQWVARGIPNFYDGVKIDLSYDMDELLRQSHIFQEKHGKDPSHGWLFQGPIGKLKAYQEYVNSQEE